MRLVPITFSEESRLNLMENCVCGNETELKNWTLLSVSSSNGHSALLASEHSSKEGRRLNIGSVDLYACPKCRTVKYIPRHF